MILTWIGWIGSFLLAVCSIPQAWKCFKTKHAEGLSWPFIQMWFWGEIFAFAYVWPKHDWPLLFNYSVNIIGLLVIIFYMLFPKKAV